MPAEYIEILGGILPDRDLQPNSLIVHQVVEREGAHPRRIDQGAARVIDAKGPGLIILLPVIDKMVKVSLRLVALDVDPQDVITRDNVSVKVNAVLYFRVRDPSRAVLEIEDFLFTHPKISEVAVFGIPDEFYGEEIMAWIQLHAGESATEEEIREYCKGQLAHFKIPKHIRFVDEFPMTVTGKLQKFRMREMVMEEMKQ